MRLFTAFELSPEALAAWQQAQRELQHSATAGAWVPVSQAHLTLHFLGEQSEAAADAIMFALAAVAAHHAPLALALGAPGAFPSAARPHIPWLGVTGDLAGLQVLAIACGRALAGCGVTLEQRAYTPHLTLGRRVEVAPEAVSTLRVMPASWVAGELVLFESTLRHTGSLHTPLARFKLGAGG